MSTWMCQRLGGTSFSRAPNPTLPIQPLAFFVWLGTCGVWIRGDFIFATDSLHMLPHILLNERATVFHGNLAATLRVRSSFFWESQDVYSQLLVVFFFCLGWGIMRFGNVMIKKWFWLLRCYGEEGYVRRTRVFTQILISLTCIHKKILPWLWPRYLIPLIIPMRVLLFGVTQCNNVLLMSSSFTKQKFNGLFGHYRNKWLCLVDFYILIKQL